MAFGIILNNFSGPSKNAILLIEEYLKEILVNN